MAISTTTKIVAGAAAGAALAFAVFGTSTRRYDNPNLKLCSVVCDSYDSDSKECTALRPNARTATCKCSCVTINRQPTASSTMKD